MTVASLPPHVCPGLHGATPPCPVCRAFLAELWGTQLLAAWALERAAEDEDEAAGKRYIARLKAAQEGEPRA